MNSWDKDLWIVLNFEEKLSEYIRWNTKNLISKCVEKASFKVFTENSPDFS